MLATCEDSVYNLVAGHSYTILSALELKKDNGKMARLIKMRDPWSTDKYKGPWSVEDEEWTPELKSQADFTEGEDNTFYMAVGDFQRAFPKYQVAMTSKNWKRSFTPSDGSRGRSWLFNFENPTDQEVVISLDTLNNKMVPDGCHKSDTFYNLQVSDSSAKVLERKVLSDKLSFGMIHLPHLKKGKYTVRVLNGRDASTRADFLLTAYASDSEVQIEEASTYLLKDLDSARSSDVKEETSKDGSVGGKAFLNRKTKELTISMKKSSDKSPFFAKIKILIESLDKDFPWQKVRSNYGWQSMAKVEPVQYSKDAPKTSKRQF